MEAENNLHDFVPNLSGPQAEIAGHPARFKVVACGRRWGKTTLGMAMAVRAAVTENQRVWWVAPTYLLSFHPWRAFKSRFWPLWDQKLENEHHIDLPGGGSITVKTADNPDGLRGVGVDFVVVDEAAFVTEEVWNSSLRPALSDRQGKALFLSTPRGRNWFYHAYQRGQDPENSDWMSWTAKTEDNPTIPPSDIEEARRTLPEHSFRQEYEAQFLDDGGVVFRGLSKAAIAPEGAVPIKARKHEYVMGIDFARYEDFTACVVVEIHSCQMVALERFSATTWALQRERIKALATYWNCYYILAEANSMGEPNIELLQRENLPVEAFWTTAQTKPALIEGLVVAIENGALSILPDPVLLNELSSFTYRTTKFGHTVYSAPAGLHDDTVIALALAWSAANPETRPRVLFMV